MRISNIFCSSVVLVLCSACGGGSGDSNPSATSPTFNPPSPITGNEGINYDVAECGTRDDSQLSDLFNGDSLGAIVPGAPVVGFVDPGDAMSTGQNWTGFLSEGRYHVVVDSTRVDGTDFGTGIKWGVLNSDGSFSDLFVEQVTNRGRRARLWVSVTVDTGSSRGLTFRVEALAGGGAQNYRFLILRNDSALPSPYLNECPQVLATSIGTTEAITLAQGNGPDNEVWLSIESEAENFQMDFDVNTAGAGLNLDLAVFNALGDRFAGPFDVLRLTETSTSGDLKFKKPNTYRGNKYFVRLRNFGPAVQIDAGFVEPAEDQMIDGSVAVGGQLRTHFGNR